MGFLEVGVPLTWAESEKYRKYVKKHGIIQFNHLFNRLKDRKQDAFRWGDEMEYIIIRMTKNEGPFLSLRAREILEEADKLVSNENMEMGVILHPEYGSFMIEATPKLPYKNFVKDLVGVEENMVQRRKLIEKVLGKDEFLFSIGNFPLLGAKNYVDPPLPTKEPLSKSQYLSDSLINPHPRFGTLTRNIRERRGSNVDIRIPIFRDLNTDKELKEIHMDAMAFGMGCACLQVTFQARNLHEARCLYDQLAVLSPIMMALTAATPFYRGMISNIDCRWDVIAASVDDRTPGERGEAKLKKGEQRIYKSRYGSIDTYLCQCNKWLEQKYNDIDLVIDKDAYTMLRENKIDSRLASHIAHLWIRDPLVIFRDRVEQVNDKKQSDHFENIQSTNWQSVRFKPPPPDSNIGWRVEFRTMEIQLTDFENAAYVVFIALLNRSILSFRLNLYTFLSQVDVNMKRAQQFDAVNTQKFWFKLPKICPKGCPKNNRTNYKPVIKEMKIEEIMCGNDEHPGLIGIVRLYLEKIKCSGRTRCLVERYLNFLTKRATGEIFTAAQWMRQFVQKHDEYKGDSLLSPKIIRDLLIRCDQIAHGDPQHTLFGPFQNPRCTKNPAEDSNPEMVSTFFDVQTTKEIFKVKEEIMDLEIVGTPGYTKIEPIENEDQITPEKEIPDIKIPTAKKKLFQGH